jgi:exodeoxyribonuclease V alpha subunit
MIAEDAYDAGVALAASGSLRAFNDAGVLAPADVHVARRLPALAGEEDDAVALALALAVRAPRLGHVYVDLATVRETATVESEEPVDLAALPWPDTPGWIERVAASPLVAAGEDGDPDRPLRLLGSRLYLDRYWREERRLAADLAAFAGEAEGIDTAALAGGIARLFPAAPPAATPPAGTPPAGTPPAGTPPADGAGDRLFDVDTVVPPAEPFVPVGPGGDGDDGGQALAAAAAVLRRFAVVAGGPGTGKTTTVARIVALLAEQAEAAGAPPPLVALAAPTGKAAARLEEAVHDEARRLDVAPGLRERLLGLEATTLHRLLGWRPGSHSRFRHHRANRLPHDVVIVDETSMVSLSLMARLVEAVRPQARLVLVGDPGQLTSIEAGAVLGDIVGPAARGLRMRPAAREALAAATGRPVEAADPPGDTAVGDGIVVLERVHRYGAGIAALAEAVRTGDADRALAILRDVPEGVVWIPEDPGAGEPAAVRAGAVAAGRAAIRAAEAGDARAALAALATFRLLCAHRRGPYGAATWMTRVEAWLAAELPAFTSPGEWYAGRPLLVTENDYGLQLYNGDTGVIVADGPERLAAAFERRGEIARFSPARLGAVETVHAMTIHKSQGSQFGTAAVLLPPPTSPILTRELLYTAVTRARERVIVVGDEDALRAAVERPAARASGLRTRLWGE